MGTPALAAHVLERLVACRDAGFAVVGVVTRPDQPRKRGLKLEPSELGASALIEALRMLREGRLVETPQDEALVTYTTPIAKENSLIDWTADAVSIERIVRAYNPWPVARTTYGGEDLLLWRAQVVAD